MRYYATIKNERVSRPACKGSDKRLKIELTCKGIPTYDILYQGGKKDSLTVKNILTGEKIKA